MLKPVEISLSIYVSNSPKRGQSTIRENSGVISVRIRNASRARDTPDLYFLTRSECDASDFDSQLE